jgi:uncharacterized membrane protein YjdF
MEKSEALNWRIDFAVIGGLFAFGTYILLKMAYLPLYRSSIYTLIFIGGAWYYLSRRWSLRIPPLLALLVYLTAFLDGIGNLLGLYRQKFLFIQYDEFTHSLSPALAAPVVVWLLDALLKRFGYRLPLGLVTLFAITIMFTIAGFYEIVELWDDKYMHPVPGMRIHGPYDTPNDLQWNLGGMLVGGLLAWLILRRSLHALV